MRKELLDRGLIDTNSTPPPPLDTSLHPRPPSEEGQC